MTTATPPLRRLHERARVRLRLTTLTAPRLAAVLVLLVVLSLLLRTTALHARYWIDEGLSVGIASHPFFDVPGVLRQDGSPPLYYLILHVWTALFGDGEARTHGLSVLFAVATVPVGYAFGRLLFDVRAGLATALLLAINPFLTYYAQETRMYALLALLSIVTAGSFALAFAERRRGWRWVFAASLALSLYTHNWALFFGVGTVVAFAVLWWRSDERPALLRDGLQAYGLAALAYLPWVPTLVFQARHTAAPWSDRPALADLWATLASVLGGAAPAMAFALVALVGVAAVLRVAPGAGRAARSPEAAGDRRAARGVRRRGGRGLAGLAALAGVGDALLRLDPGAAHAPGRRGPVAGRVARAARAGAPRRVLARPAHEPARPQEQRARRGRRRLPAARARRPRRGRAPGVRARRCTSTCRRACAGRTRSGSCADPAVMDWRDALDRLRAAKAEGHRGRDGPRAAPGAARWCSSGPVLRTAGWRAPWTKLVKRRAVQWQKRLDQDPRLLRTFAVAAAARPPAAARRPDHPLRARSRTGPWARRSAVATQVRDG